jgi:aldehyde dehydrogenase (NAD+)
MGNRVIASASEAFPLAATDFIQVLETSDVPAGVVNILTGDHSDVASHMGAHMDIDAVWSFSDASHTTAIEAGSASNIKRTLIAPVPSTPKAMLEASTEVKNIWIPYGE